MKVQPLRRFTLQPGRVLLVLGGTLLLAIAVFWSVKRTTTQQPSFPVYTFDERPHCHLAIRANTGNNAIPNWLGYDPSLLSNKPLNELDSKGRAVRQGQALECMMRGKVGSVAASKFQDIGDLVKYGYRASFTNHPNGDFIRELGLDKAFADLGLSSSGFVQVNAGNSFNVKDPKDNKKILYPASYATFSTEINPAAGVMVATQSYGPEYMADKYEVVLAPGQTLTPLQKVSDLLFLSWKKLINDRKVGILKNLEHMFRWNTIVPEVQTFLSFVAGRKTIEQIGEWPGVSYPISEMQGLATLSSPNAKGVAWLLGQHKEVIGVKIIDRVSIFNCPDGDGEAQWCVYLHVVAVTAEVSLVMGSGKS